MSAPPPYEFNHTVSVDVLETADPTGAKYSWLNIIDVGTSYQVVTLVPVRGGQPSSAKCLQKFMQHWVFPFWVAQGSLARPRTTQQRCVRARAEQPRSPDPSRLELGVA